jgi:uncharacterized protein YjiS (DUF1127 family)
LYQLNAIFRSIGLEGNKMSTIDTICGEVSHAQIKSPPEKTGARVGFKIWLKNALVRRQTRMHLSELTDEQLKDIGVSKSEARSESARFFWERETSKFDRKD